MVQIGFNATDYNVSEDVGRVTFFIEKQGTNEKSVTVSFSTADSSATCEIALNPGSGDYDGATGKEATQVV